MKKAHIITLSIVAFLAACFGIYYYWYLPNQKKSKAILELSTPSDKTAVNSEGIFTGISSLPLGTFPLKYGDKNKRIAQMQAVIRYLYESNFPITGYFGPLTKEALLKYLNTDQIKDETQAMTIINLVNEKGGPNKFNELIANL